MCIRYLIRRRKCARPQVGVKGHNIEKYYMKCICIHEYHDIQTLEDCFFVIHEYDIHNFTLDKYVYFLYDDGNRQPLLLTSIE